MYALVEAIGRIALAAILWWASGRGASNAALIATVVVFKEYIEKFFIPIRDLSAKYAVMQGAMAASERIFQLLDTEEYDGAIPPGSPSEKAQRTKSVMLRLEFLNLSAALIVTRW